MDIGKTDNLLAINGENEKKPALESETPDSRRGFIKYFLLGSALAWILAAFYGFFRFFSPQKTKENALPKSVDLTKNADSFEINSSMIFRYGDRPAILIREKTGKFKAYFATCPHLGCMVQYNPQSAMIVCPCHDGVFDLNGKNFAGPPTEPLDHLVVHVNRTNKIRIFIPGTEKE
jgi:cytochrome b6-f complex iron-sulfur subunit